MVPVAERASGDRDKGREEREEPDDELESDRPAVEEVCILAEQEVQRPRVEDDARLGVAQPKVALPP